jgi:predicted small lipoprotein YifL
MKPNISVVVLTALFSLGLLGCEQKGPAEEAGAKVDDAMGKAGDKLEEAGEAIKEKAGN